MIDWTACTLVVSRPGFISGAPALRDDPRMPADAVIDNLDAGLSPAEVIDNHELRTPLRDILLLYDYARHHRLEPSTV